MALTPERIKELQSYSSGGATAQPSVPVKPASGGGFLADEAGDLGITSAAKSLTRNVLSAPVAFGKELVRPIGGLISKTNQLALDFSTKTLGADNPFTQSFADTQKTYDYIASLKPLDQGVLGKTSENFGGKLGGFGGQIAPYFLGRAQTVGGRALLDTGISYAQTGDVGKAATTGLVSAATGLFGPLVQGTSKLLRGGKAKPVTDLITKTDIAKKFFGSVAKGTGTGYVAGTTQNLAEGQGSEAFVPDITSVVGGVIGGVAGIKPMKDAFKVRQLQQTQQNMDKLTSLVTQGKIKDIEKAKGAITQLSPDEIKSVKTYQDYEKVLNNKISNIEEISDKALETNKATKKLIDLSILKEVKTVNGVEKVADNYVQKGLSQLDDYYTHINDVEKAAQIKAYIKKANTVGLDAKDINEISKIHGKDLNGFNANNVLSNGLAQKTAENTRKGMKDTVYEMFGNKELLKQKNDMVNELSNTRDLAKAYSEKVNKFEQSSRKPGYSNKIMNGVKNIVYGLKFMVVKTVTGLSPTVNEKMTPVEIEKNLNSVLTNLNNVLKSGKPESVILKELEIIGNTIKNFPAKIQGNDYTPASNRKPIPLKARGESTMLKTNQEYVGKPLLKDNPEYTGKVSPILKKNNQAGAIRISGVKATNIHPEDAGIYKRIIATDEIKNLSSKDYIDLERAMERFKINPNQPFSKIKKQLDDVLQGKRKVKGTLLPGSLKKGIINPLTLGATATAVGAGGLLLKNKEDEKKKSPLLKKKTN